MKIQINPKSFLTEFVNPILDINKGGKTALFIENNEIYTTYQADDGSGVNFYQRYLPKEIRDPVTRVNVDLNELSRALNCISTNPEAIILDYENRKFAYKDETVSFGIRTLENEMVPVAKFNPKKLEEYPNILAEISMPTKILQDLKKADSFANESLKFYLEKEGNQLFVMFGDKLQKHLNSIKVLLKDNFDKDLPELIYNISFLRAMFRIKNPLTLRILDNGAIIFLTETQNNTKSIYATTKLQK